MKGNNHRNPRRRSDNYVPKKGRGLKIKEEVSEQETPSEGKTTNDPDWYMDPALAQNGANLFFSKPFGSILTPSAFGSTLSQSTATAVTDHAIPGIMTLKIGHVFGSTFANTNAPINIASEAEYAWVRKANSGSRNYDAPDLTTAELALAEVYSAIGHIQRAYGALNRYYPENRYFARAIVNAMGFDFDDLLGNSAQFAYFINIIISKASAFAMPGNKPYYRRRAMLYQNVYLEDEGIKDQIYMYVPAGFYFYTIDSTYPEGYLKFTPFPANAKLADIVTYMNAMLQGLLDSEDIGIMSGDIIKAYGDNLIRLSAFDPNYVIQPIVHDYNVLYQIKNAIPVPITTLPDLHQDATKAYLVYTLNCTDSTAYLPWIDALSGNTFITSSSPNPSVAEVMESSRLMFMTDALQPNSGGTAWSAHMVCGTELCLGVTIYDMDRVGAGGYPTVVSHSQNRPMIFGANGTNATFLALLQSFKYHPTFYSLDLGSTAWQTATGALNVRILNNFDNVATVDPDVMNNIHQVAIMNMLAAPSIAML